MLIAPKKRLQFQGLKRFNTSHHTKMSYFNLDHSTSRRQCVALLWWQTSGYSIICIHPEVAKM
jgi:hypothetical protein